MAHKLGYCAAPSPRRPGKSQAAARRLDRRIGGQRQGGAGVRDQRSASGSLLSLDHPRREVILCSLVRSAGSLSPPIR
eukprot:9473919-Pyramimonas_sp.AAC.1